MRKSKVSNATGTAERQRQFEDWFQSPLGRNLLANERESIHQCIEGFYGYYLLEMPVSYRMPVGNGSLVRHRMIAVSGWQDGLPDNTVVAMPHELPFENDSLDAVILHHTLDFAQKPHQVLREASRVLVSGGHILVVGFNPYGLWGLCKLLSRRRTVPWCGHFISPLRLEDWLTLLDFRLKTVHHDFYQPPLRHRGWLQAFSFLNRWGQRMKLPAGAYYVAVAQKRVAAAIRPKPRWRKLVNVGTIPAVNRVSREITNEDC